MQRHITVQMEAQDKILKHENPILGTCPTQ